MYSGFRSNHKTFACIVYFSVWFSAQCAWAYACALAEAGIHITDAETIYNMDKR
jgi:hypothetical protein